MRRAAFSIALILTAMPAFAACPSLPDNQDSSYVENRTALALCQQRELGLSTDRAAANARLAAELGNLQIELERQRIRQQQMIANWSDL
jgi:hypothetical protein